MELIFAAALCSVMVSILLKTGRNRGLNPIHLIAWNYATASVLCYFWFKPDLAHVSVTHTPWLLIFALGILLPSVFLLLARALQTKDRNRPTSISRTFSCSSLFHLSGTV